MPASTSPGVLALGTAPAAPPPPRAVVRPLPEEPGQAPAQRTARGRSQDTGSRYQAKVAYSQDEDEWISTLLSLRGGPVWSRPAIHRAGRPPVFPVMEHVQANGSPDWGPLT